MEEPTVRIKRVEYYYTVVPNRVGAGAKVFNELKAQDVSLIAFNGFPLSAQRTQLDLVPSSGVALVAAAQYNFVSCPHEERWTSHSRAQQQRQETGAYQADRQGTGSS